VKWLVRILLTIEAALLGCALTKVIAGDTAVLWLAANSVVLIWSAARLRRKPSCCR
jgi:hypothetical protein